MPTTNTHRHPTTLPDSSPGGQHRQKPGRPLKVLHIGNIANNAYLNAKIMNSGGFDCDVICYDYYHSMGCPEWEDADFEGDLKDHFEPDWESVDLKGFKRPRWFAQGPLRFCIQYLMARRKDNPVKSNIWWFVLNARRKRNTVRLIHKIRLLYRLLYKTPKSKFNQAQSNIQFYFNQILNKPWLSTFLPLQYTIRINHSDTVLNYFRSFVSGALYFLLIVSVVMPMAVIKILLKALIYLIGSLVNLVYLLFAILLYPLSLIPSKKEVVSLTDWDATVKLIVQKFTIIFPNRPDQLTRSDILPYTSVIYPWSVLLDRYDVIIGYSTDGILPLLCGKRPYFAFEHGTLRSIPFEPTQQGRLCALTYHQADESLITNCDNIDAAKKLGLQHYRFIPHPVNEDHRPDNSYLELRKQVIDRLKCNFIVFHPSRHHWEASRNPSWEKGNDILIHGFARFVNEINPEAAAIFVDWGKTAEESKRLLNTLGISDRILWISPQTDRKMITYIMASDLTADQFFLGAFGRITPKALLHGCPAMLYLNEERHRWCFPELPPVLNTRTSDDVFMSMKRLYQEPRYREDLISRGRDWYRRYHSNEVILRTLSDAITKALAT
ncbi:MAG: hypothetical protein V1809_00755 [Planctomycetota bacterium]